MLDIGLKPSTSHYTIIWWCWASSYQTWFGTECRRRGCQIRALILIAPPGIHHCNNSCNFDQFPRNQNELAYYLTNWRTFPRWNISLIYKFRSLLMNVRNVLLKFPVTQIIGHCLLCESTRIPAIFTQCPKRNNATQSLQIAEEFFKQISSSDDSDLC